MGSKGKKGSRSKTAKTIRAIANTALKTGGEVYIEHESADGEKLKVHVNPGEALLIVQPPRRGNLTEGLYIGLDYEKVCFVEKKFP
ncbi:hypothetical protein [Acetobacter pasteurianus]|uniref:hypothetical protein n=1 Tax=Acetobacter pasteurianus TaxID=438 RepID=UPI000F5505F6|nr:hypothetical protein [Acetobacter pasteurianus]